MHLRGYRKELNGYTRGGALKSGRESLGAFGLELGGQEVKGGIDANFAFVSWQAEASEVVVLAVG
jgi:hypothetical protein